MSSAEISTRASESSAKAQTAAVEQSRAAERATTGAFTSILAWAESRGEGTSGSTGVQHGDGVARDHSIDKALQIRDQFVRRLNLQDQSQASALLAMSLSASAGTPGAPLLKDIIPKIQAELKAAGETRSVEMIGAAVEEANSAAQQHGINRIDKLTENYVKSEDFRHLSETDKGLSERISADVRTAQGYRSGAAASYREADEYRQMAEYVQTSALSGKLDWTPEFHTWMNRYHRDKLGATGEELWALQSQFFREGGIGVSADGKPSFSLYDGYGPGNVTPHPVGFSSDAHNDPSMLRNQTANADIGGSHGSAAAYGYRGESVVRDAADAANLGSGPAPTAEDGKRLNRAHVQSKERAVDAYDSGVQTMKEQVKQDEEVFEQRASNVSFAHNLTGNPVSQNPALSALKARLGEQPSDGSPADDSSKTGTEAVSFDAIYGRETKVGSKRKN